MNRLDGSFSDAIEKVNDDGKLRLKKFHTTKEITKQRTKSNLGGAVPVRSQKSGMSAKDELRHTIDSALKDKDKKMVVILKKNVVYLYHGKVSVYGLRSLFIFHGNNPIRRMAYWIVDWA